MNDMLGNPIVADDVVLYDGAVCKCVSSTTAQIKYVYGRGSYEHGTTMNHKVLKLTGFEPDRIDLKAQELSPEASEYVRPSKIPLSIEEQGRRKVERDRRNALKKATKPFDIITTGSYDNLIYLGQFVTAPTDEEVGTYHVYAYAGYASRGSNVTDEILNSDHNRSFTLSYQKSKKQPTSILVSTRNEELKTYLKSVEPRPGRRSNWINESYAAIRELFLAGECSSIRA
jgi:hypothetical protein